MPRALTEQEKCRQCQKLLDKGKGIILSQGIKKISIDEITKAAGMAKGTFYHHFETKEKFLVEAIMALYNEVFIQTGKIIQNSSDIKKDFQGLLMHIFDMPELNFFMKYYDELMELTNSLHEHELESANQAELGMFKGILDLLAADTERVKPGVVHNYMLALYLMKNSGHMIEKDSVETYELMTNNLITYIFGGMK
jgi:AcrR family transcriptional regulator